MSRRHSSKFEQPFEEDLLVPSMGINAQSPYGQSVNDQTIYQNEVKDETDKRLWCHSSVNMWVSPEGYVETRPGFRDIVPDIGAQGHMVAGMYYSNLLDVLAYRRGSYICFWDKKSGKESTFLVTAWANLPDDLHPSFVEFIGSLYIAPGKGLWKLGGVRASDGTWAITAVQPTPAANCIPTPDFEYVTEWKERLWGYKGSSLYASGYRTADDFGPVDPASPGPLGGHVDIRPGDGADIKGMWLYEGGFYVIKGDMNGNGGSFWQITGSSFLADSSDPFSLRLINEGFGCISPHTISAGLNTVLFVATDKSVYSEVTVKELAEPQIVSRNSRVFSMMLDIPVRDASYQPRIGYYFLIQSDPQTKTHMFWAHHWGNKGWWLWRLGDIVPVCSCPGPSKDFYIGGADGHVYAMSMSSYGKDNGYQYTSGFSSMVFREAYQRGKFYEWYYLSYIPLGPKGTMGVSFQEQLGLKFRYSLSPYAPPDQEFGGFGWDDFEYAWDASEGQWDIPNNVVERRVRVNRQSQSMQILCYSTAPFRLMEQALTGGINAKWGSGWTKIK